MPILEIPISRTCNVTASTALTLVKRILEFWLWRFDARFFNARSASHVDQAVQVEVLLKPKPSRSDTYTLAHAYPQFLLQESPVLSSWVAGTEFKLRYHKNGHLIVDHTPVLCKLSGRSLTPNGVGWDSAAWGRDGPTCEATPWRQSQWMSCQRPSA